MEDKKYFHTFKAFRTKSGLIALWERGGAELTKGDATILMTPGGSKPTAIFIRRSGDLANANHALIPVYPGYLIVRGKRFENSYRIRIYKILKVNNGENPSVDVRQINFMEADGRWHYPLAKRYQKAIEELMFKLNDHHCRRVYYAELKSEKNKKAEQ